VIALREIAERNIDVEQLRENMIQGCQEKQALDVFGVEEDKESTTGGDTYTDEEVKEEFTDLNQEAAASDDKAEEQMYGEDDVKADD